MSHLVVTMDDKLVGEFPVDKDKLTIGRKSDNDICINNLAVSGYHSQIITVLDSSFLEDLNSTNGTYVNTRLVKKHALEDGDLIDIGNHRIRFVNESKQRPPIDDSDILEKTIIVPAATVSAPPEKAEQTITEQPPAEAAPAAPEIPEIETPAEIPAVAASKTPQATPAKSPEKVAEVNTAAETKATPNPGPAQINTGSQSQGKLQVLSGKNAGLVLDLHKSLTTFGSQKIAVAGVTKRANGYFLVYVQGKPENAPLLNGERVQEKAQKLDDHDIIEVSGIKLEFFTE